ncbi:hypothetical protein AHiyo6_33390, partial [Arthrobacter sp. Hiyo6]
MSSASKVSASGKARATYRGTGKFVEADEDNTLGRGPAPVRRR